MTANTDSALSLEDLAEVWAVLSPADRVDGFRELQRPSAEEFFLSRSARDQAEILSAMAPDDRRSWVRLLPPDDAADLAQETDPDDRAALMALLDDRTRSEVRALLAYSEDEAGGLMSPRCARLRPDMTVEEAIAYLRRQAKGLETVYYLYVLDETQKLLGVLSFRELLTSPPNESIRDLMHTDPVTLREDEDQEIVGRLFKEHGYLALPVLDPEGHLKGIVTLDDIIDVVQEEATEDIHKAAGVSSLEAPYLQVGLLEMVKKRGVWLAALFVGELLTASAMARFEDQIASTVVLALFVPLIISSGGNSGSQASTLVIRAMALGEVRLLDWWRVVRREITVGLCLGAILGLLGFLRVVVWHSIRPVYGDHFISLGISIALSLVGVVSFGTFAGSLLPFVLRAIRLDPASASAPFVATLVDVTGLIIYFSTALLLFRGA